MKPSRFLVLTMFLSTVVLSPAAHAVIDADATVVKLRTSCNEGGTTLNNCFVALETIGGNPLSGLQAWVDARASNAPPLVIEIGPGTFKNFNCDNKNDISLKGSGPEVTKLSGTILSYGIQAWNCQRFNVQDLSVVSPGFAVVWNGTGSSRWTNVTVEGGDLGAWVDGLDPTGCPAVTNTTKPVHYWFNSRLRGRGQNYIAYCSENWFFGSEFTVTGKSGSFTSSSSALVVGTTGASTTAKPEVHVYGSVVRVMVGTSDSYPPPTPGVTNGVIAVVANRDGEVHLHGTGIDVINTGGVSTNTIAALSAYAGGSIHAHGSAYNLRPASATIGKAVRIIKDTNTATHVHAPYQWEEHTTPPIITSVNGADVAIETDCAAAGCATVGTEQHILIYRDSCKNANGAPGTNPPWWDVIVKKCR